MKFIFKCIKCNGKLETSYKDVECCNIVYTPDVFFRHVCMPNTQRRSLDLALNGLSYMDYIQVTYEIRIPEKFRTQEIELAIKLS